MRTSSCNLILRRFNIIFSQVFLAFAVCYPVLVKAQSAESREFSAVDRDFLGKMYLMSEQYKFNMANYIPTKNLPQNDNGEVIARRILKHTAQRYLDDYKNNDSPAITTAAKVNNNMKTTVGSDRNKVKMRMRPLEASCEVNYYGPIPVDTSLSYEIDQDIFRAEISKVYNKKTYGITHVRDAHDSSQIVGVRWKF